MPDADMTLQEAAELLGVHYMTAYRYVRLGLLPADKVGSAWRVRREDVEQMRSGSSGSGPMPGGGSRKRVPWSERLEARLLAGDGRGAWGVVEAALAAGTELDDLYLDVVAPALASIGVRWESGEIDVATEHRASGIAMRILGRLGPRFVRRGRTRGSVVIGAPVGEQHFLPLAMLGDLLRAAGWEVSDLGADVPPESFARIARTEGRRLVALGVSVTSSEALVSARETIETLHREVPGVPVFVGGGAVRDEVHALSLGAEGYAPDGRGFVALLEEISRRAFDAEAEDAG